MERFSNKIDSGLIYCEKIVVLRSWCGLLLVAFVVLL